MTFLSINTLDVQHLPAGSALLPIFLHPLAIPNVARCLSNLGVLVLFRRCHKSHWSTVYGDEHPDVATVLNNLGTAWKALGDTNKACEHFKASLKMYLQFYDQTHPYIKAVAKNIEELTMGSIA